MEPTLAIWSIWVGHLVRGGTQSDHLEHLGGLVSEMVQKSNKADYLELLRGLGPEMTPKPFLYLNNTPRGF